MSPVSEPDLERLAKLAKRRRADLGLALTDDTAKAAGFSKGTWQRVEKAQRDYRNNYAAELGIR